MEQNVLLDKLQEIKGLQESAEAVKVQIDALKVEVLAEMDAKGVEKLDASDSVGVYAIKITRRDYHFNDAILMEKLGERYKEVLKVDKKRVKDIEKEIPEVKEAIVIDKETSFLEIKKAKNGSTNLTPDTI